MREMREMNGIGIVGIAGIAGDSGAQGQDAAKTHGTIAADGTESVYTLGTADNGSPCLRSFYCRDSGQTGSVFPNDQLAYLQHAEEAGAAVKNPIGCPLGCR